MKKKSSRKLLLISILGKIIFTACADNSLNSELRPHFPSSDDDYYQADSLTGHFHKPNVTRDFKWVEHPDGKIIMKTNNVGLRNDFDCQIWKARC